MKPREFVHTPPTPSTNPAQNSPEIAVDRLLSERLQRRD
jgi:hypothetical protein